MITTCASRALAALILAATAPVVACGQQPAQPAAAGAAQEQPKQADNPNKITLTALIDFYYQYSFNHPPAGTGVGGRQFDVKNDSFSLAVAEINATKAASAASPYGFTATLTVGKNADLVHATEPGGTNTYRYLQQIYATYLANAKGKNPVTIDFGKWASFCGYEVIESVNNDNYSRSFLYTFGQPLYHMGLRVGMPITDRLSGGFYIVNGWNNVEDDNGGKTLGATLAYNSGRPFTVTLNWMGGDEGATTANGAGSFGGAGFATAGIRNVQQGDLIVVWQPTPRLKLALNSDYASAAGKGAPGGNWNGTDVYARYQFTPSTAFAARYDHFEDSAGLRTGTAQNLNSVTATVEHVPLANLILRLEYRHDKAGTQLFPSGGGGSSEQDTFTLAGVIKL